MLGGVIVNNHLFIGLFREGRVDCFMVRFFEKKNKENWVFYCFLGIPFFKVRQKSDYLKYYLCGMQVFYIKRERLNKINAGKFYKKFGEYYFSKNEDVFVDILKNDYERKEDDVKIVAFYLPQYHFIPENDANFGKGFTEWVNVTKAKSHFVGHYQPHIPYDVGFYDLESDKVMYRQIELAKKYGVYGFCFYYYWFSGQRLLEKPIFNYLNNKELDFPFCFMWANETWMKLWDGGNREIIKEQIIKDDDKEKFFDDILPFFKDNRYIKIDGKPLLMVYRTDNFSKGLFRNFFFYLQQSAVRNGLNGIYLMVVDTNNSLNVCDEDGIIDAKVSFPPHKMNDKRYVLSADSDQYFKGEIYNSQIYVENIINKLKSEKNEFPFFKTVFPSWDNTARKAYTGASVYYGMTPSLYKDWLKASIDYTKKNNRSGQQFVFVNAWNEWAEGAHLEPDLKYGYAYLQATRDALEETRD